MQANQYHMLHRLPAVEAWEMSPALERLAQRLARSGLLRINADQERNYVRHGTADRDLTFTARELTDAQLLPHTRRVLARLVPPAAGEEAVSALVDRLQAELKKARGIDAAKEMRVARVAVQSTHPAVIELLLQSRAALHVSYSHTVADLLAVHEWQSHGQAGGLQATSAEGAAVYISCGGDPFFAGEHKTYLTDGFPALARMMVIGAQEFGHFADLLRSKGQILGRYSTDNNAPRLRAAPVVNAARQADMARLAQLQAQLEEKGLAALARAETAVAFYDKRRKFSLAWAWRQAWRGVQWLRFRQAAGGLAIGLRVHPRMRYGTAYLTYLADMAFNLAPEAEAYRRADPQAEEAIACIEALARVPQQVMKWGHEAVRFGWPGLYAIYFGTVLPGCVAAAGTPTPVSRLTGAGAALAGLRRLARKRPQYYPESKS